jgi:hypothetical protein
MSDMETEAYTFGYFALDRPSRGVAWRSRSLRLGRL